MKTAIRFSALILGFSMLLPALSYAETATSVDAITQLKQKILELQAQILELQKQQQQVTLELLKNLGQGASGDDVKTLQALLAGDSEIYPEGKITGFFGPLTVKALKKFQAKHGIEQVGFAGPKTLKKLNELLKGSTVVMVGDSQNLTASTTCTVLPPGHYIAPGWNKKMSDDHEDDDDGDNDNDNDKKKNKENKGKEQKFESTPFSIPCNQLPPGIAKKIGQGTTTPPLPDTIVPTISNVVVGTIIQTGASITWTTSEPTRSKISYGTSTAYTVETGFSSTLSSASTQVISSLTSSTVYHFKITAKDAAGNTTSTGDMTFTTASVPPPTDTTAPVISSISVGGIASTTANVTWTTNELARSKVYYGTTTPLSLSSASFIADSSLVTSHTKTLSSLTASTTHYYVIESQDGADNIATSTENSFTTLP